MAHREPFEDEQIADEKARIARENRAKSVDTEGNNSDYTGTSIKRFLFNLTKSFISFGNIFINNNIWHSLF